jgi:hypothetical protein
MSTSSSEIPVLQQILDTKRARDSRSIRIAREIYIYNFGIPVIMYTVFRTM